MFSSLVLKSDKRPVYVSKSPAPQKLVSCKFQAHLSLPKKPSKAYNLLRSNKRFSCYNKDIN